MDFDLGLTDNWYFLSIAHETGWKDVQLTLIQRCKDIYSAN